jgi:hypothetical protein
MTEKIATHPVLSGRIAERGQTGMIRGGAAGVKIRRLSAIGYRLSAIGYRLSAISYQLSAISYQLSAISR